jgi:hypothetical protein
MNKFRFTINTLAVLVFTLAFASLAQGQATRTWVSGVGDDANPCSRTAPCKTFAGAISKTALNGEINCLDPGAFGALTITKSITVDCHEIIAGVLHSAVTGVNIPYDSFATPGETRKTVRLRNLNFNGGDTGLRGIRISGGVASANSEVFIEDCMMDGSFGSPGKGIEDVRTGGGLLFVNNTTIRDVASSAISVDPAPGTTEIKVTIANSRIGNSGFGLTFGSNVKASIFRTVITGVTSSAVFAVATGGSTQVNVDHCIINSNGTGVNASSANTTIRVSNSTLMNNTTLFTAVGAVQSYGNNDTGGAALGVLIAQN